MPYSPVIQKAIDYWSKKIEETKGWNAHGEVVRKLEEQFPEIFYHSSATVSLSVSIRVKSADQVVAVLRWLRGRSYRSVGYEDSESTKCRKYRINHFNTETKSWGCDFELFAYFSDEGACKFVEVGKKTVPAQPEREVPIMELRCGDEALPVEA